ncbi:MAG: hypothetical protein NVV68_03090 [Dokdonella sp.]|nr:hypothetical protein [Dokdonella sp.]
MLLDGLDRNAAARCDRRIAQRIDAVEQIDLATARRQFEDGLAGEHELLMVGDVVFGCGFVRRGFGQFQRHGGFALRGLTLPVAVQVQNDPVRQRRPLGRVGAVAVAQQAQEAFLHEIPGVLGGDAEIDQETLQRHAPLRDETIERLARRRAGRLGGSTGHARIIRLVRGDGQRRAGD